MTLVNRLLSLSIVLLWVVHANAATTYSIYELQYTTDPNGEGTHTGEIVDCTGGIVTHKFGGFAPKLTLYDPNAGNQWAGIQIKDWTANSDLYDAVSLGDWVSFTNVGVEEHRGNTLMKYDTNYASTFTTVSTGNAMPTPIVLSATDIPAPPDQWAVTDHDAEKYEAMWLEIQNVTVSAIDLGAHVDNYSLTSITGDVWAADYMNENTVGDYHPYVQTGKHFASVTGILEQYTKSSEGWDYYQLLTTASGDFVVPEPASILIVLAALAMMPRRRFS